MSDTVRRWRTDDPPYGCPSSRVEVVYARDYDECEAERYKLAATVRRVSALLQNTRSQNILACEVSRALAEPMDRPEWTRCEITGCNGGPMHGYGKCVERRKP